MGVWNMQPGLDRASIGELHGLLGLNWDEYKPQDEEDLGHLTRWPLLPLPPLRLHGAQLEQYF